MRCISKEEIGKRLVQEAEELLTVLFDRISSLEKELEKYKNEVLRLSYMLSEDKDYETGNCTCNNKTS